MNNIMIDIETMGINVNSAIISIGAVYFDNNGIGKSFLKFIDLKDNEVNGLSIEADVLKWWSKQSTDLFITHLQASDTLEHVLRQLTFYMSECTEQPIVWSNGVGFDHAILKNAYNKIGLPTPWDYKNERCYRTLKNLFPQIQYERRGREHNPLDDAYSQALHLKKILNHAGIKI